MRDVVIVAGCRTPIGTIGGQFKTLAPVELTIPVMQNLIKRAGIDPVIIDDVIWGCNYQRTYKENNLARVAAEKAGLPVTVPGITIHRNCTSSMSAIQMGFYQIRAGEAECIMAGGSDSMSTAPHMVFNARYGQKYGHMEMRDSMWDSLTNLGVGPAMGITAENVADKYDITREQMDAYSLRSQQRAVAAIDAGRFEEEIIPVTVKSRKSETVYTVDEYPKRNATLEGLQKEAEEFGAFIADQGAEQCGFCNPGMIMNAIALFRENPDPSDEEIKEYLAGNLCRCSGYEGQMRGIKAFLEYKKNGGSR